MLAVRLLEKRGYSIQVADNGRKALEMLEKAAPGEFAVVLMDVQMPIMDGYEATAELRKREAKAGRHTPIVAVTAHAMKGDRERCLAAGMDDYVSKPIHAKDLFAVLDRLTTNAPPPAPAPDRAEPPAEEPQNGAIDKNEVLGRVDGDIELLRELHGIFVAEYPKLLTKVREAMSERNGEALGKAAHTIKGMLANLGLPKQPPKRRCAWKKCPPGKAFRASKRPTPFWRRRPNASPAHSPPCWRKPASESARGGRRSGLPPAAPGVALETRLRGGDRVRRRGSARARPRS